MIMMTCPLLLTLVHGNFRVDTVTVSTASGGQIVIENITANNGTDQTGPSSSFDLLRKELYTSAVSPYDLLKDQTCIHGGYKEDLYGYPHTHLTTDIAGSIFEVFSLLTGEGGIGRVENSSTGIVTGRLHGPELWLEAGSFIGNSAINVATEAKKRSLKTHILAVDPFTGDVNMWAWHKEKKEKNEWDFLKADAHGIRRIFETFLANVVASGHQDSILPLRATSTVGMRLIQRLNEEKRIDMLPSAIYLDSAHEQDETLMELNTAWSTLANPGVLCGDDWGWAGVQHDVIAFAKSLKLPALSSEILGKREGASQPVDGLVVWSDGTWIICKAGNSGIKHASKDRYVEALKVKLDLLQGPE